MNDIWENAFTSMSYLFALYIADISEFRDFPEYIENEIFEYFLDIDNMLRGGDSETIETVREIAKRQLDSLMVPYRIKAEKIKSTLSTLGMQYVDAERAVAWYGEIADEIERETKKGEKND